MWLWDYQLPKDWQPRTSEEWCWFLVRKINYGDFTGLKKKAVREYFPQIEKQVDPGKRAMLKNFFER